jgi:hypothetical protein
MKLIVSVSIVVLAVALALSFIMIIGIAANTDPEEPRLRGLEARNLHHSCGHNISLEVNCTQSRDCDTRKGGRG